MDRGGQRRVRGPTNLTPLPPFPPREGGIDYAMENEYPPFHGKERIACVLGSDSPPRGGEGPGERLPQAP
jgi:hypothetical protein